MASAYRQVVEMSSSSRLPVGESRTAALVLRAAWPCGWTGFVIWKRQQICDRMPESQGSLRPLGGCWVKQCWRGGRIGRGQGWVDDGVLYVGC